MNSKLHILRKTIYAENSFPKDQISAVFLLWGSRFRVKFPFFRRVEHTYPNVYRVPLPPPPPPGKLAWWKRGNWQISKHKIIFAKSILSEVKKPVHIQVFVSLTCPHCPVAAAVAHKLAIENDLVKADVIDSGEFPDLAQKYAVMGVPKIIINEKIEFVGAFNEDLFAEHVLLGAF